MFGRGPAWGCAASRVFVLTALTLGSSRASADDTKRACARSAENGQRLRDEGKPLAARAELLACGQRACPAIVRAHCARWLEQIDAAIPTVVFQAHAGPPGHAVDVTDVAVAIDGVPALQSLDGQARRVEPGQHTFRYTRRGSPPVETSVLLVAGEKNRLLTADFPSDLPATAAVTPSTSPAPDGDSSPLPRPGSRGTRPAAWVFAGVAVVGGAGFAYFGATGKSQLDSLRATCEGHCGEGVVSSAWNRLIVSDLSLAVGVVSAGLAAALFLAPRHAESAPAPATTSGLLLGPNGHGLTLGWHGAF